MQIYEKTESQRILSVEIVGITEEEFMRKLMAGKVRHEFDYFYELNYDKIIGKITDHGNFKTKTLYEIGE